MDLRDASRPTTDPLEPEADLANSGVRLAPLGRAVAALVAGGRPIDVESLLQIVESPAHTLHERHAAGTLLAIVGDPRLVVDDPMMIDVPAASVPIGIDEPRVDEVVAEWAALGVQREWILKETPRHTVQIDAFRIARYPVTNGEYLQYVLDDPSAERPSSWGHGIFPLAASNHPVFTVSPAGADGYVAWLAARSGRRFRLPTEAEWEYAATGGDGREFPWGDTWDPSRANTAESGPLTTTPVGIHVEGDSPVGCADMAGNVEEYVADDYAPYPGAARVDDDLIDVHGEQYRIARGGSFARHGDLARCARRHGWYPSAHYAMGFRLAEDAD